MSKKRSGFVSNSSSSSFIIGTKNFKATEEYKNLPKWVIGLIDTLMSSIYDDGKEINNVEELNLYFIDQHGWGEYNTIEKILEDDDGVKTLYHKMKLSLDEGFLIFNAEVDYSDEGTNDFMNSLPTEMGESGIYMIDSD